MLTNNWKCRKSYVRYIPDPCTQFRLQT